MPQNYFKAYYKLQSFVTRPVFENFYAQECSLSKMQHPLTITKRAYTEGWAQDYCNSNIFLKPLFRGNLDPFVNNANLGAIAHMSNGT